MKFVGAMTSLGLVATIAISCGDKELAQGPGSPPRTASLGDGSPYSIIVFSSNDRISIESATNLLARAGIRSDQLGSKYIGIEVPGSAASVATEVLKRSSIWSEVSDRQIGVQGAGGRSLLQSVDGVKPGIENMSLEEARAALDGTPGGRILSDPSIVMHEGSRMVVKRMYVVPRTFVTPTAATEVEVNSAEVRIELRTANGGWGREWTGEVLPDGQGGWRSVCAFRAEGDRRR